MVQIQIKLSIYHFGFTKDRQMRVVHFIRRITSLFMENAHFNNRDYFTPCKDSTLWISDFEFQVLDSCICQSNLDSGFQSLVGFRIPWAVLQIPKHRICDFSDSGVRIPLHGADYSMQMFTYLSFRRQQIRQLMVTIMNKTEADAIIPALTLGNNGVLSSLRPSLSNLGRAETW